MPTRLSPQEIDEALSDLKGWTFENDKFHKTFTFSSFNEAFGFLCRVALHAERLNHHPELFNVYAKVTVDLSTHDVGGVSELDVELAKRIDAVRA